MKRPLHFRAAALLWALAFVLGTVGEGFGLHPCPHHDGGATTSTAATAGAHNGHHGPAAAPAHSDEAAAAVHAGADHSPGESHDGHCTCGSACQAGGAALPGTPQSEPADSLAADVAPTIPAETAVTILRSPHFLPFAQAPPRLG